MRLVEYNKVKECTSFWTWLYWNNSKTFRLFGVRFTK